MKIEKATYAGVTYYQVDGGAMDFVKDEKYGWISVNGFYFDWVKGGKKAGEEGQMIRWKATEKEVAALEQFQDFIKQNEGLDAIGDLLDKYERGKK